MTTKVSINTNFITWRSGTSVMVSGQFFLVVAVRLADPSLAQESLSLDRGGPLHGLL